MGFSYQLNCVNPNWASCLAHVHLLRTEIDLSEVAGLKHRCYEAAMSHEITIVALAQEATNTRQEAQRCYFSCNIPVQLTKKDRKHETWIAAKWSPTHASEATNPLSQIGTPRLWSMGWVSDASMPYASPFASSSRTMTPRMLFIWMLVH